MMMTRGFTFSKFYILLGTVLLSRAVSGGVLTMLVEQKEVHRFLPSRFRMKYMTWDEETQTVTFADPISTPIAEFDQQKINERGGTYVEHKDEQFVYHSSEKKEEFRFNDKTTLSVKHKLSYEFSLKNLIRVDDSFDADRRVRPGEATWSQKLKQKLSGAWMSITGLFGNSEPVPTQEPSIRKGKKCELRFRRTYAKRGDTDTPKTDMTTFGAIVYKALKLGDSSTRLTTYTDTTKHDNRKEGETSSNTLEVCIERKVGGFFTSWEPQYMVLEEKEKNIQTMLGRNLCWRNTKGQRVNAKTKYQCITFSKVLSAKPTKNNTNSTIKGEVSAKLEERGGATIMLAGRKYYVDAAKWKTDFKVMSVKSSVKETEQLFFEKGSTISVDREDSSYVISLKNLRDEKGNRHTVRVRRSRRLITDLETFKRIIFKMLNKLPFTPRHRLCELPDMIREL